MRRLAVLSSCVTSVARWALLVLVFAFAIWAGGCSSSQPQDADALVASWLRTNSASQRQQVLDQGEAAADAVLSVLPTVSGRADIERCLEMLHQLAVHKEAQALAVLLRSQDPAKVDVACSWAVNAWVQNRYGPWLASPEVGPMQEPGLPPEAVYEMLLERVLFSSAPAHARLDRYLDSPSELEVLCALRILGRAAYHPAAPRVRGLLNDSRREVRYAAIHAIGHVGDSSACADLIPMLESQDRRVVLAALDSIMELRCHEAEERVRALTESKSRDVRRFARYTLHVLADGDE